MRYEFLSQSRRAPSFILEWMGPEEPRFPSDLPRVRVDAAVSNAGGQTVVRLTPNPAGKYWPIVYLPNGGGLSVYAHPKHIPVEERSGERNKAAGVHNFYCVPFGGHEHGLWLIPVGVQTLMVCHPYRGKPTLYWWKDGIREPVEEFRPLG